MNRQAVSRSAASSNRAINASSSISARLGRAGGDARARSPSASASRVGRLAITPRHAASLNAGANSPSSAAAHMRMSGSSLSNSGSISGAVALTLSAPEIAALWAKPWAASSRVGSEAPGASVAAEPEDRPSAALPRRLGEQPQQTLGRKSAHSRRGSISAPSAVAAFAGGERNGGCASAPKRRLHRRFQRIRRSTWPNKGSSKRADRDGKVTLLVTLSGGWT